MKRLGILVVLLCILAPQIYAATITSAGSGAWATGATWVGGSAPADGDDVVIASGHSVQMNADTSAFTGLGTVTVNGTLYFKDGASGYLKLRTGKALTGTGYLLANSDGVWATNTALANTTKAVIDLQGTAVITATDLQIKLLGTNPTLTSVRMYGTKYDVAAGAGTVSVANNSIDLGGAPPSEGTAVMITTATGTLPGGLSENFIYYVRGISGNTVKLATTNADANIVDITSTGSGTVTIFTGAGSGSATVNVLDDVTGDAPWSTTAGHNRVVVADIGPSGRDIQITTLATINAGSIVLGEALDSAQFPGARIWLSSRNVSIRNNNNSTTQNIISGGSNGILRCEIVATASTAASQYCYGIYSGSGYTISGTITGCNTGLYSGSGYTISGTIIGCNNGTFSGSGHTILGTITGCTTGIYYGLGHTILGTITGCTNGIYYGLGHTISRTITGCNYGIFSGSGYTISGTITGCNYGLYYTGFVLTGTSTLNGNTTDVVYSGIMAGPLIRGRAFNYGGVANDDRAWSAGGAMTHDTTVVPSGKTYSHKFTHVDSGYWTVMEYEITSASKASVQIMCYGKHDATSLAEDARLHFQIVDPSSDPLIGGTAVAEWIAADSTDWQNHLLTYQNTSGKMLWFRVVAKRGSGNAYFNFTPVGGGRSRIILF